MAETEKSIQKEHADLYKRSIKGGYWVFAIRIATQILGLVKSIIVFNILLKQNLELIYVSNLLIAALVTFSESGFHAALVHKKEDIESYLDTAWVIGIIRGIILFAAIYFIAPLFASMKVDPDKMSLAISVIRAMGICFVIQGFQNIGTVYFQKELQFHKTFLLTVVGTIVDIVLSISLLLIYRNVWAVVIARLISAVINTVMTYLVCTYRPKFKFVAKKAKDLWKYGKWLFGGNIIGYLLNEGDDWFVLFFFLPDAMPFNLYRSAYRFANIPTTHVSYTISQVSFPAYSKIQHDLPRLREAYLKILHLTAILAFPVAFMIFILGPDFVKLTLVEDSYAMIPVFQICAITGLLSSLGSTRVSLFRAVGKPHITTYLTVIRLLLLFAIIYPFTKAWGITGTALATVTVALLIDPIALCITSRTLSTSVINLMKALFVPMAASLIMFGVLIALHILVSAQVTIYYFLIRLTLCVLLYSGSVFILDKIFKHSHVRIVFDQIRLLKNKVNTPDKAIK